MMAEKRLLQSGETRRPVGAGEVLIEAPHTLCGLAQSWSSGRHWHSRLPSPAANNLLGFYASRAL